MADIRAETRAQFLERLFLVAKVGELGTLSVLLDVACVEFRVFEARIVENEKIAVLSGGSRGG